jgi:uncharacterized membrane protein YdjX (TVP38/TMEM64 family)
MDKKKDFITSLIIFAFIAGLIVTLCVTLIPILIDIFAGRDGEDVIGIIHSHGARGVPVLACLQALQVITTVVPAILIQIPAGLVYGTLAGLAICLAGSILGNMIVFIALRQFSTTIDHIFPSRRRKREEKARRPRRKSRLPFFLNPESLNRMPHPELVAFYVYLIPGIPNGVLPHIFARTKVSFARYLIAVVAGNAPSTLVCTLVGDRLAHGDWRGAVIIIVIFAACIGVALLLRRKLITLISGGYSLNLGAALRRQADTGESDAAGDSGIQPATGGVKDEAGRPGEHEVEDETARIGEAADEDSEAISNNDAQEDIAAQPEADDADDAKDREIESGAESNDPAADELDENDDGMRALGTTDIIPHGWRVIKGKKP